MVSNETVFKGEYNAKRGLCMLATASKSVFSAYPDDVQFDFYVGLKGTGKLVCFDSVLEEDYTLSDVDEIQDYFSDYMSDPKNWDKAEKALSQS